ITERRSAEDKVPRYPSNDYCIDIANRVVGYATRKSGTDGISICVTGNTHGNIRWARNQVSTSGQQVQRDIWITSISGSHTGRALTNEVTDQALKSTTLR